MTEEEDMITDEQLISRYRAGEEICADMLLEKYKTLVRYHARALYLIGGDNDDLIQEGMLGLFKAVRDYKPDKEASFASFASLCITRQMYSAVQASNRQKHAPLNSYVELSPEIGESMEAGAERSPEDLYIDQENMAGLYRDIKILLSSFENQVLDYYLEGKDYTEIAEIMRKRPKSIDNALQRIRQKISKSNLTF